MYMDNGLVIPSPMVTKVYLIFLCLFSAPAFTIGQLAPVIIGARPATISSLESLIQLFKFKTWPSAPHTSYYRIVAVRATVLLSAASPNRSTDTLTKTLLTPSAVSLSYPCYLQNKARSFSPTFSTFCFFFFFARFYMPQRLETTTV